MPPTPPAVLTNITNLLQNGQSGRQIALALGVSKTVANNQRKLLPKDIPKPKGGRPCKLSDRETRIVARLVASGIAKNAEQVRGMINRDRTDKVSVDTIRRALKKEDYVARRPIKKPALTADHRRARLRWALAHKEWTLEDWKRVVWSDATKINRIVSDGQQYVWVKRGEGLSDRRCQPTVKFGGGNIMTWGCMTWAGVGKLARVEGRMDSRQFCTILEQALGPTLDACALLPGFPPRNKLIFQQDNDSKHRSKKTKAWFEKNGVTLMD